MARDEEYMRWAYQYLRGEGFPPGEARKMRSWTIERILKAIGVDRSHIEGGVND